MDADRIRELVSRREGEHIDFKREGYARDKGGVAATQRGGGFHDRRLL